MDAEILLILQNTVRNPALTPLVKGITVLGNGAVLWVLVSIVMLVPEKTRRIGIAGILALLVSLLINNIILKNLVARVRPYEVIEGLIPLIRRPRDYSFPSGHTASSFAAAGVFFRRLPKWLGVPALLLAVLMGLSRLYVGVHYPTDVLVGLLSGLVLSVAAEKMVDASEAGGGIRDMWRGRRR